MQAIQSFVCQLANRTADGKVNALGVSHYHQVTGPPIPKDILVGIVEIVPEQSDLGKLCELTASLLMPDQKELSLTMRQRQRIANLFRFYLLIPIPHGFLRNPGPHLLRVKIDGCTIADVAFEMVSHIQ